MLLRVIKGIDRVLMRLLETVCILLSLAMACVIGAQIVIRLVATPLLWSEEAARIMMVWLVFLGAAYLYNRKSNGHIVVDVVHQILPERCGRVLQCAVHLLVFAILVVTAVYGFQLAGGSGQIKTTALKVSYRYIYSAIPVSACLMLWFGFRRLVEWLYELRGDRED